MEIASRSSRASPVRTRPRLHAAAFYGIILTGVVLGSGASALMGWASVQENLQKVTGVRIWDGIAEQFVIPICAMVGATFGGLMGLLVAIALESCARQRHLTD